MKHLTHWILALAALAAVASFSTAWTSVQEPPKKERKLTTPQGKKNVDRSRVGAKHANVLKVMPGMKTTLAEAIQLAEKEAGGKAFSASIENVGGKASIQISLFVNDKVTPTTVDPETKKVTIGSKKADEHEDDEDEGEQGEHDQDDD